MQSSKRGSRKYSTPSTIADTTQKNNKKTQKSIDKIIKRVYNIIIKEIKKSPIGRFIKG